MEHIDLYQMHRPDPAVPIEETLGAFTSLVESGKVAAVGTSTFPAALLDELQQASGSVRPTVEQPPYSILARGIEDVGAAGVPSSRPRRAGVGAAQRRLADREVPVDDRVVVASRSPG